MRFTGAIWKLLHLPWRRGKGVPQDTRPDGVLILDGADGQNNVVTNWEYFTGKQSLRQLKDRVRAYGKTEEMVVWVAQHPKDLEVLKKYCARLRNPLFLLDGSDDLVDLEGNTISIDLLEKTQG